MHLRAWPGSPRRLLGLVLVVTIAPSILLVVLGWRLFQEDRKGELRALEERREHAADQVVSALERAIQQVEQRLDRPAPAGDRDVDPGSDAVVVHISGDAIGVVPPGRVAYVPGLRVKPLPSDDVFASGEAVEFRKGNPAAAATWFANLASRADADVKPGALLRLARNQRKQRADEQALATYETVAQLPASTVEGAPSDLLARWLRCDLLASLARVEELQREASTLIDDLRSGRWTLTRSVYETNVADAARWSGRSLQPTEAESLAMALDDLWQQFGSLPGLRGPAYSPRPGGPAYTGRRLIPTTAGMGVGIWRADDSSVVAFVALPSFVERRWLGPEQSALDRQRVRVALQDPAVRGDGTTTLRRAFESGLPWTVAVTNADAEAELARLNGRRTLWLIGLAALAALVVAGMAVAVRAVSSELAVARLQSDFVSAVSHEFRTPLTSLRQISEVLQDARVASEEERRSHYGVLGRQTDRLHRLVEQLLDLGRMEAGAAPYRPERASIDRLVRMVVDQFTTEASARGESVALHVSSVAVEAPIDREAMANAIRNLIDNAIKYSPATREAWVDVHTSDGGVGVSVRDRGMGIPDGEQREIFRKFRRGARPRSERIAGTGIGLAIVHHVVTAHGGTVSVESQPDQGSTFTIWLPHGSAAERSAEAESECHAS